MGGQAKERRGGGAFTCLSVHATFQQLVQDSTVQVEPNHTHTQSSQHVRTSGDGVFLKPREYVQWGSCLRELNSNRLPNGMYSLSKQGFTSQKTKLSFHAHTRNVLQADAASTSNPYRLPFGEAELSALLCGVVVDGGVSSRLHRPTITDLNTITLVKPFHRRTQYVSE